MVKLSLEEWRRLAEEGTKIPITQEPKENRFPGTLFYLRERMGLMSVTGYIKLLTTVIRS